MLRLLICVVFFSLSGCLAFQPVDTASNNPAALLYELPVEEEEIEEENKELEKKAPEKKQEPSSREYLFKIEIPIGKKSLKIEW